MKINRILFSLILITSFVSCNGQADEAAEDIETNENEFSHQIEYISPIRPDSVLRETGKEYIDTLVFVGTDDNYDYWYCFFETVNNDTVRIIYGEDVTFDENLPGSILEVKWEIDSFYEAGEGDELYFNERIISYTILEQADGFLPVFTEFIEAYLLENDNDMDFFLHESIGTYSTFNPGVYCMLEEKYPPNYMDYFDGEYIISDQFPDGFICDEFKGVEDGFYYKDVTYDELPEYTYSNEEGDFEFRRPEIPKEYTVEKYRKIMLVAGHENGGSFYFIKIDGNWYFWIEHLCDCSA